MTSFREYPRTWNNYASVQLIKILTENSDLVPEGSGVVWDRRRSPESDFAYVFEQHVKLVLTKYNSMYKFLSISFKFFFSYFTENQKPQVLRPGLWNCSVNHFSGFKHHLACNLKIECENEQDETAECPFSSAYCQGLVDVCDRCYMIITDLSGFDDSDVNVQKASVEHCRKVGASLGVPKCVSNWMSALWYTTNIHSKRLQGLWVGVYFADMSVPNMYRHSLIHEDKTVYHHPIQYSIRPDDDAKSCFASTFIGYALFSNLCLPQILRRLSTKYFATGAVCEIRKNNTEKTVHQLAVSASSTYSLLLTNYEALIKCAGGHFIHISILCSTDQYKACDEEPVCSFPDKRLSTRKLASSDNYTFSIPRFTCRDGITVLSYLFVCDFMKNCQDNSDESFCQHPRCINMFTCSNSQCLSYDMVCDHISHCWDESDEKKCSAYRQVGIMYTSVPAAAMVNFDNSQMFAVENMTGETNCPESHYRCPSVFRDCLPVYTLCNGMFDCVGQEDEQGCESLSCPWFFRCRSSTTCLHSDHVCDGWPHCPMNDDELLCDIICPEGCLCEGQTFLCWKSFSVSTFPQLRYINATGSGMTLSDASNDTYLIFLDITRCSLSNVPVLKMLNLKFLDLSDNELEYVNLSSFLRLVNLQTLSMSRNPIVLFHTGQSSQEKMDALTKLDLSHTLLTIFDSQFFSSFADVQELHLNATSIHSIGSAGFSMLPSLSEIYMDGSPIRTFPFDVFKDQSKLRTVSTDNYKLCCDVILPSHIDEINCHSPKDEVSSCADLLFLPIYRAFLWMIACLSIIGNGFCCCARLFTKHMASSGGFGMFVTSLAMADFLMGIYIAIIGIADQRFRGRYLHYDDLWKNSVTCKMAGFLSLVSSEVSALIIWIITFDRFIVLCFPFSAVRFSKRSAVVACVVIWSMGCFLAALPLLPMTSHWEFYSQTGICIPLPVTRGDFKGKVYSFGVLIVLNFVLFLLISAGQAFIYWSIQNNAFKTDTTRVSQDMRIARRLLSVAVTDFLCWFPIGLCGVLALAGTPIPGEVNVSLAIFVLPMNSAVNPFLYTFNRLAERRRKSKEAKLAEWIASHDKIC